MADSSSTDSGGAGPLGGWAAGSGTPHPPLAFGFLENQTYGC
jgi:hypothetical protein